MLSAISQPRPEISAFAPRLLRTKIDPEKIGALIGPGGKMIRAIQEDTGAVIEVEDDGTVTVASNDMEGAKAAMARVEAVTASVQVGRIYEGRVTSIKDFGAFIEILPGKDGLCHISELSEDYINSVSDVCQVGDMLQVKVIAVDDQDRVKLSRKAVLREAAGGGDSSGNGDTGEPRPQPERTERHDRGGDRSGGDRGGSGDRGRRPPRGGDRGRR
jgi:polyribonucleotide nucleotidyltransferase